MKIRIVINICPWCREPTNIDEERYSPEMCDSCSDAMLFKMYFGLGPKLSGMSDEQIEKAEVIIRKRNENTVKVN